MFFKHKKTPYHGLWAFIIFMMLPSVVMTVIAYSAISKFQPQFNDDFNLAMAKIIGFGLGILFHASCGIVGAFSEDYKAVKTRLKELFSNLNISLSFALKCYWEDVATLGLAFWIDVALIGINVWVFIDALADYFAMNGVF